MSYQIFISYRRETGDYLAKLLKERLKNEGYTVFLDVDNMQQGSISEQVRHEIENCEYFVPVMTEGVYESTWIRQEYECAIKNKKKIIPVLDRNFKFAKEDNETIKEIADQTGVRVVTETFESNITKLKNYFGFKPISNTNLSNIKDSNEEFKAKYTGNTSAELFLDKDLEEPIYLSDVYVQPKLVGKSESLKDYLLNWSSGNTPVLLLCGKAGIGKTSLVSELISTNVFNGNVHAVFLREKTGCFDSSKPWESVKKAFSQTLDTLVEDDEFTNKILILDGFDELCVLQSDFKGEEFLNRIADKLPVSKNIRVLITSREYKGYFEKVESQPRRISVEHIKWSEKEMKNWCDHYSSKRNNTTIAEWCNNFKNNYNSLNNKRKEIFCTPIILYICCHENIDISQDKTIVEIYDKAFKNIVKKEYENDELQQETGLSAVDGAVVMWQLIKELAYQMHLNDKLKTGAGTELINNAKSRVLALKENIAGLTEEKLSLILKKLPAIFHFATESTDGGYEFAHKTVGEYFSAVKLYEDYFADFNTEYYIDKDENTVIEEVFRNIIEAFRYGMISVDIWEYLNRMDKCKYTGTADNDNNGFTYSKFEETYINGMKMNIWSEVSPEKPLKEYKVSSMAITGQISCAFRNLSFFLTGHGYRNEDDIFECKIFRELIESKIETFNGFKWNLSSANLSSANLRYANLRSADLSDAYLNFADLSFAKLSSANMSYANMSYANLSSAKLESADLSSAKLSSANLRSADLSSANLSSADLRSANLRPANLIYADLSDADLRYARYTAQTKFSDGFSPKEHGMIEIDYDGNPVNRVIQY